MKIWSSYQLNILVYQCLFTLVFLCDPLNLLLFKFIPWFRVTYSIEQYWGIVTLYYSWRNAIERDSNIAKTLRCSQLESERVKCQIGLSIGAVWHRAEESCVLPTFSKLQLYSLIKCTAVSCQTDRRLGQEAPCHVTLPQPVIGGNVKSGGVIGRDVQWWTRLDVWVQVFVCTCNLYTEHVSRF